MLGIAVENVSHKYKGNSQLSLDTVNLDIKAGYCIGLIGPNGAGKSTLLSILSGLITPSSGNIKFIQNPKTSLKQHDLIKQHIALVPQEYAFYIQLTVLQNLEYFVSLCALNKAQQQQSIQSAIKQCQLQDVLNQKANALSGGFKRRLNLAIALLKDPQILYLDEPTVGVDPVSRKAILELIDSLKKQGKTIIFTSHMLSEIQSHCDNIFILKQGKVFPFDNSVSNTCLQATFTQPLPQLIKQELEKLEGCLLVKADTLKCTGNTEIMLRQVMQFTEKHKLSIDSIHYGQTSLTEHYLNLMEQHDPTEH